VCQLRCLHVILCARPVGAYHRPCGWLQLYRPFSCTSCDAHAMYPIQCIAIDVSRSGRHANGSKQLTRHSRRSQRRSRRMSVKWSIWRVASAAFLCKLQVPCSETAKVNTQSRIMTATCFQLGHTSFRRTRPFVTSVRAIGVCWDCTVNVSDTATLPRVSGAAAVVPSGAHLLRLPVCCGHGGAACMLSPTGSSSLAPSRRVHQLQQKQPATVQPTANANVRGAGPAWWATHVPVSAMATLEL
jgi:hypothetical protein